jgi:glycosyltransferase involved in cell wall biosynthesis
MFGSPRHRSEDGEGHATLLVLTLNEIDGMRAIMPQIEPQWFEQILIVDGGSTDGTIEWAREHGYEIHVQTKRGIRHAYLEALPLIRGDIALSFSPDGNCDPACIPPILAKLREGYDLVIGSRYLGESKSDDDVMITAFGNWLFTKTVNLLHRASYTDAMVIFRAFRTSLIGELDLDREESYRLPERLFGTVISWEPLMSVRAAKAGMKIAEVGVGEPPRIGGERKLQILRWGAAYYFQFWWELWYWRPHALSPADPRRGPDPETNDRSSSKTPLDLPRASLGD